MTGEVAARLHPRLEPPEHQHRHRHASVQIGFIVRAVRPQRAVTLASTNDSDLALSTLLPDQMAFGIAMKETKRPKRNG